MLRAMQRDERGDRRLANEVLKTRLRDIVFVSKV